MTRRHHRERETTVKVPWTRALAKARPGRAAFATAAFAALLGSGGAAYADLPTCDSSPGGVRLNVAVTGVRSADGLIAITIYPDDSRRFLVHKGQVGILRAPAKTPTTRVCIALPSPGVYAAVVYHDANADHRFNRNAIGMPSEAYGFSNDPKTLLGLPAFDTVRFKVQTGDNAITIGLHYPGN